MCYIWADVRGLRQTLLLARNDLLQEVRHLEVLATALFFDVVVLALFGVGFGTLRGEALRASLPAMLWLSVAFVGSLALTRLFEREREHETFVALLVAPVERLAIYGAKALVGTCVVVACAAVQLAGLRFLFPEAAALFDRPLLLALLVVGASLAYVAVGAVFASALATDRTRGVLLGVVLYPLTAPVLLFALVATRALIEGHAKAAVYVGQVWAVAVLLLSMATFVFESVVVPIPSGRTQRRRR